ncbi:MAG: TRAP transporter small permease [Bacillota bacterium]|jgi:TRAP-type C4-dicarboxylate transport system permease small subunit|nr:TRAP transporter small permease [Bacillota bacterium]MDD3297453.1 TRAP transporter small permease [Bacillota bacterium]MDD3850265.1 TRAP transporter small permease [Bacillota bacterium]MDD4707222.1 TRAP transporter small permease [Bacillota bacterium]
MERFGMVLDRLNRAVEIIASGMLTVMVIVIFLQVVFRSMIKSAIPWSEELARYIMVWISFLGAGIAVRRKGHIGVEALVRALPKVSKRWTLLLANILSMVFYAAITVLGFGILQVVKGQVSPAMELSMAIPYSAIFTGGMLMLLYSFYDFLKALRADGEGS